MPSPNEIMYCSLNHEAVRAAPIADPEGGGQGVRTPSRKSQIKSNWTPPGKSWTSGKNWTPSGALKNDRFLWNWPFDFCKISWDLKKSLSELYCQTDLDPPPPPPPGENSWIRASVPCLPTVNIQKRMLYCHISSFQADAVPNNFI